MTIQSRPIKKLLSVFICLAMLFNLLPLASLMASAADSSDRYYDRVTDESTLDGWKNYFPLESTQNDPLSTKNAGGVWTDKSVFTNANAFPSGVTMLDENKHFLTALSAIAANKEIVGYSAVPTDTVFILDLSNSMSSGSVEDLVEATNNAINTLQQMNNNNRVGVVLYSGSGAGGTYEDAVAQLMPINRYTTTDANNAYVEYESGEVRLARNRRGEVLVSGSNGAVQSESKEHNGATYIQAGLWAAWEMFNAIPDDDVVIGDNNWQSGEARMPIVVLMSDGAPTLGTTAFDNVPASTYGNTQNAQRQNRGKANVGNGNDRNITDGQGFLVQLTASYVRNRIENKYRVHEEGFAGRSLFYTLGFNINSISGGARNIAMSVLNPAATTNTDALWSTYNRLSGTSAMSLSVKGRDGDPATVSVTKNSYAVSKLYVDEYFPASGDGLTQAFGDIVDEILLQSRYYPTHLEGGNPDFSGYVEFTDTLGEYMEVKHVTGILLGNALFDGHMLASKLTDNSADGLGTPDNPTALGNEFIWSIQARLGISGVEEARRLVAAAYNAGQLYYRSDSDWSNYIGWYADAAGKYLGHWDETVTQTVPAGAVYRIKSYGFLGQTTGSIKNSDMMYMSVQVRTDIATGMQTLYWKIPASLIPIVTYLVEVDGASVDVATNVRLQVDGDNAAPIRLVYESGLRADLNEFNITRITDEKHLAADGHTRLFWNNYFANLDAPSHDRHVTTMSAFTPNKENERFYYTFDSAVHKLENGTYTLVTESEGLDPDNGTYYHRRYIFSADSDTPIFYYEPMSKASVRAALTNGFDRAFESLEHQTVGAWVVPAGTPARELDMYDLQKNSNPTDSARMVFHPYMTEQNNLVYVDMNLGNNGLLSVTPATGLRVSKTVDIFEPGTSDTFKFRLTASANGTFDGWITALDATPSGEPMQVTVAGGVYEFELRKDQTFWLSGLLPGTDYTVEEISDNSDYKIKSVKVNNTDFGAVAQGTVARFLVDDVRFVNTAVGEGDLVITKQVVDAAGNPVDISDSVLFTAQVALTDKSGAPVSGTFPASNAAGQITVPADGVFTVTLKEGESFIVRDIPEETRYIVTETNIPAGFALDAQKSKLEGVVDATANDQALVVNTYAPVPVADKQVEVEVTKTISGNRNTWQNGESYTFELVRLNAARAAGEVIATATVSASDNEKTVRFSLANERFTAVGTYYYNVLEVVGTQGGITYDTALRSFVVSVADADMDGDLEIVAVTNVINTVVTQNGNAYTVSANFNNVYAPTGSATVTLDVFKRMQGNYRLNGFQFALYSAADIANADEVLRSTITDAQGYASFSLVYAPNRATMEGVTYTYWLAEIDTGNPNITYDSTVYKVEITVKDNGDGTISATPVIEGLAPGETAPVFTNVFTPSASAYVTLSADKTIEGDRMLNAGEFAFVIEALTNGAPLPAETTVYNAVNGAVLFDTIEFSQVGTYVYKIYESDAEKIGGFVYDGRFYEVTVIVTDNGDATLSAAVRRVVKQNEGDTGRVLTDDELMHFVNRYDATDATVTLSGDKLLTGKTLQADEFSFTLSALTANAPMPVNATVRNAADGTFSFGEITYSKAGTYVYTLSEVDTGDARYDFDTSVYTVTVTVTDNSRGLLTAAVLLQKDRMDAASIVFRNGYVPEALTYDIHANFGGKKVLEGRPLEEGEFTFNLINAINGEQLGESVTNAADGSFAFPAVTLPEVGTYHFKITESVGDEKGVSYDTSNYHVVLGVEQAEDGTLSIVREELHIGVVSKQEVDGVLTEVTAYCDITDHGEIVFTNTYKAVTTEIVIDGTKTLEGRELVDGEFFFELYDRGGTLLESVSNVEGTFAFAPIPVDTAGDYVYTVKEAAGDDATVTYDNATYTVTVTVTDNLDGTFGVAYAYEKDGEAADAVGFVNVYTAPVTEPDTEPESEPVTEYPENPKTGESTNLSLLIALLFVSGGIASALTVCGKKKTSKEK